MRRSSSDRGRALRRRPTRWSDLDVFILPVDDPERYAERSSLGCGVRRACHHVSSSTTAVGGERERRVLYETGEDVDLPLIPVSAIERLEVSAVSTAPLARGYRVLVDKLGLGARLQHACRKGR